MSAIPSYPYVFETNNHMNHFSIAFDIASFFNHVSGHENGRNYSLLLSILYIKMFDDD